MNAAPAIAHRGGSWSSSASTIQSPDIRHTSARSGFGNHYGNLLKIIYDDRQITIRPRRGTK